MSQEQIVKKGTFEFKAAQTRYLTLFFTAKAEEYLKRGVFEFGDNKGKFLGCTTQKILDAKLPKPFGCSSLFIQPCIDDKEQIVKSVIWFCGIDDSICVCCREDFKEAYPDYCNAKFEPDDCTIHQGECEGCPSRWNCKPDEFEELEEEWWEDEQPDY